MKYARQDFVKSLPQLNWRDDRLYVVWAPGFRYELISPFDNLASFSNFHQLVIGWPQRTPIFEAMKRKFKIEDVTRALFERPDVFFVGQTGCNRYYVKYIQEHYSVDVDFVVKRDDGDFVVKYIDDYASDMVGQFEQRPRSHTNDRADRATLLWKRY